MALYDYMRMFSGLPYGYVDELGDLRVSFPVKFFISKEEVTIVEMGMLYVKDMSVTTNLLLENVGVDGIIKRVITTNYDTEYNLGVIDNTGQGAKARAYCTITDGTNTQTVYTVVRQGSYKGLTTLSYYEDEKYGRLRIRDVELEQRVAALEAQIQAMQ